MLKLTEGQLTALLSQDRGRLISDVVGHLRRCCPWVVRAYPAGYLRWVIDDSIEIAHKLGIDDVYLLRVFVQLRWEISPGFYKQPQLRVVLTDPKLDQHARFAELTSDHYASAWEEATHLGGAAEWRERFWGEMP